MYRIGELASLANVSKRTIDYYTSIGLLKAQRSKSNYRIYTEQALEDLRFIEECKNLYIPLEEIKRKLEIKKIKEVQEGELKKHILSVTQQMKQLQIDLNVLIPLIENLEADQAENYSKLLNTEGEVLLKSLSELTG
ncbi:MerR family transcriptional regulator [Robertmurraya siralis]|uniref:MerR family transcriptional regulator n=1 Tax=Robertmurraya siralis TaxID=77777 RepID=A0A920BUC3_9BACI|nr:MerR family transcriptional regulator [Robertmurraya siralis]PAE18255.1 MerR family transcriptional regulator [Bacillus sp. 7504-2]GIN62808.1 MerR family transcriptional regulator [Robertmurraya siralis]